MAAPLPDKLRLENLYEVLHYRFRGDWFRARTRLCRKKIEVAIANSRGPATLASLAEELGPDVVPQSVQDACQAEMIFLAVPFSAHRDVAKQFGHWNGRIVVDVTNAFHVPAAGELIQAATIAIVGAIPIDRLWHAVPGLSHDQ
jgi:predicted dinucleotide-binding enzyme